MLSRADVPEDAALLFCDRGYWFKWDKDTPLPTPALDPVRVKVGSPTSTGECLAVLEGELQALQIFELASFQWNLPLTVGHNTL